jgi:hypothetical protein
MHLNQQCRPEGRRYKSVSRTGSHKDTLARPDQISPKSALEVAEKLVSFVGRAFRHDVKSALSSGVLTPEGLKPHFSATCLAAEAVFGRGTPAL